MNKKYKMKKLLGFVVLGFLLSGCTPAPKNIIGQDTSWIKPYTIIFVICAVVVGLFLIWFNKADKENKKFSDDELTDFVAGVSFLAGPGLFTAICYVIMVITGFLLASFYIKTILAIIIPAIVLFVATLFILDKILDKKK